MSKAPEMVHKIVLKSKKVVLLRDPQIRHQDLAMKAVGNRGGENQFLFGSLMQKELLKMLVVQIDGLVPTPVQLENLDGLFTLPEYRQVSKVLEKLMGADDLGEPEVEIVSSGNS